MSAQLEHIDSSTALAPAQRAAIALDSAKHRTELVDLVKKSSGIVAVLNADGRDEAHRAGMVLKNARVNIQKRGKEAREDATAFSKAVIAEEKTLVDLIAPEEERVLALRDKWDAQVEAERQAKIAAERARVDALLGRVAAIRNTPALMTGKSAEEISRTIGYLAGSEPGASFEEFEEQAKAARLEALDKLAKMETEQRGVEIQQEAARQEAARQRLEQEEEAARLKAEREELARLRAEQAERMEAEQRQQREALAAERAEADRIRKLEDEARAARQQAEREELERQNEAMRLERARLAQEQTVLDESKRVAAEAEAERVRRQAEADRAAEEAATRLESDHAEALAIHAAGHYYHATMKRGDGQPIMCNPNGSRSVFCDLDEDKAMPTPAEPAAVFARPSDEDIIQVIADHFGVPIDHAYGWLIEMSHDLVFN